MKTGNCPSCGAQVQFKSAASAMAVCSFCRGTVLRDGASAENMGKLSEILDDYSPIQLGTTGAWKAKQFAVIGRLRLKYGDGAWNEWSIEFQDGTLGWLSDASGQFIVTRDLSGDQRPRDDGAEALHRERAIDREARGAFDGPGADVPGLHRNRRA